MDSSLFAHRGHALRRGRLSESGRTYLLTAVTHERQTVFQDWSLARLLVREMRGLHDAGAVESLAWVVMPDHLALVGLSGGDATATAHAEREVTQRDCPQQGLGTIR